MTSLLHNPFTDLVLPYFLMLYAAVGVVALVAAGAGIWLADDTRDEDLPDDASPLDPYAIAWLRGSAAQVARLAVFDLIERGYLELTAPQRGFRLFAPAKMLRRSSTAPDLAALTPIQRTAWNWVMQPRLPSQITHRHLGMVNAIRPLCSGCTAMLQQHRLLETRHHIRVRTLIAWLVLVPLTGAGLYRLAAHIVTDGRESFSLILPMLVWVACTAIICRPVRLSDRGHRYLEHLALELGDWHRAELMARPLIPNSGDVDKSLSERLRRMALFGCNSLCDVQQRSAHVDDHRQQHELVKT
jgi:uncharacterized protein (TIGR04222 family)